MRNDDLGCGGWIVVAIILFFVWKWYDGSGSWTGWVYPDASDLTRSVRESSRTLTSVSKPR